MNIQLALSIVISILVGIGVFFLVLGFFNGSKSVRKEQEYDELLDDILESEIALDENKENLPDPKSFFGRWYLLATKAGVSNEENPNQPGTLVLILFGIGLFIGIFAWPRDIIAGIGFGLFLILAYRFWLSYKANARLTQIENQLPAMLAGLRANIAASQTPQQALMEQAEEQAAPLGDELKTLRDEINLNIPLDKALSNLSNRIPSTEIHFLVSSLRIAISEGADLDPLLETLQDIMVQRKRIKDKLKSAIAQAQPAMYVTGIAIPGGLLFSYVSSTENQSFWLSLMGLVTFLVVGILYVSSLFVTNKQIQKIKDS